MFHNNGSEEDEGVMDELKSAEFGCDYEVKMMRDLELQSKKAWEEGLPVSRNGALKKMMQEHISVFRLMLVSDAPGEVARMKI